MRTWAHLEKSKDTLSEQAPSWLPKGGKGRCADESQGSMRGQCLVDVVHVTKSFTGKTNQSWMPTPFFFLQQASKGGVLGHTAANRWRCWLETSVSGKVDKLIDSTQSCPLGEKKCRQPDMMIGTINA